MARGERLLMGADGEMLLGLADDEHSGRDLG